jgi:non-heme chloroperoxidase
MSFTSRKNSEMEAAEAGSTQPVVFAHGLWLLASSRAPWRPTLEAAGPDFVGRFAPATD